MKFLLSLNSVLITLLLLFVGGYLYWGFWLYKTKQQFTVNFKAFWLKLIIRLVALSGLFLALLYPYSDKVSQGSSLLGEGKVKSHNVYIALDLSLSMLANDVSPNRLERAKHEVKKLIKELENDKVGLIIFSSSAFVQSPLTYDKNMLLTMVEESSVGLVPHTGTDFSAPLTLAFEKFEKDKSGFAPIVILISDGEDFGDETSTVIQKSKDSNVPVFSVGLGTTSGGQIRLPNGQLKRDKNNQVVTTVLKKELLKEIAVESGGAFYQLNNQKNDFGALLNSIRAIDSAKRAINQDSSSKKMLFPYFLIPALLLLLFDLFYVKKTLDL